MPMVLGGSGTISSDIITSAANGNVGIGNSSPSTKLSVNGEAFFGRADASLEGGEIKLARSSDNLAHYSIDCYGGSTTPSMRFIDNVAGAVRIAVDSSGRVTKPTQPAFLATKNTGNLSTTGGEVVVPLDYTVFNIGSCYNTSTYRFTVPVTGVYMFMLSGYQNGTQTLRLDLYVNGARFMGGYYSVANSGVAQSVMANLNANDYVSMYLQSPTTTLYYGGSNPHTFFAGYFLG